MEAARAAAEGMLHVQGPDPDDLAGKDRRRLSFRDVAASMTIQAVLDGDQDRLAVLDGIAGELVRNGQEMVAGSDDAEQQLATIQGWAQIMHPENHHPRQDGDNLVIEYQHPEEITAKLAPVLESHDRSMTAFRLQAAYTMAMAQGRAIPADSLLADLADAQDLAGRPPQDGPVRIIDPVAAVAAAAVIAHARGQLAVPAWELSWAASIVIEVAASPWRHPLDSEYSVHPIGADRSAAAALPLLLLPALSEAGTDPAELSEALQRCATSAPDEVRIIFSQAAAPVWAAPCHPVTPSGPCCHQQLWAAAIQGLRDCQLGDWSQTAQRQLIAPVEEPFGEALAAIPTSQLLLNRLTSPLITAAAAAHSPSCAAGDARALLSALLPAHQRATLHWAKEGYSHPGNQHGPAAARTLAELAASGDTGPLTDHVRALTADTGALATFLHDLATEFTYNQDLRPALATTWRPVMTAALDELERDPGLLDDDHWTGTVLGGLLPRPDLRVDDTDPDSTLKSAQETWPHPGEFADLVTRWLPIARGYPGAADGLVRLARCAPPSWQASTGLTWAEDLIADDYPAIASRSFHLPTWLGEIRPAIQSDTGATARWRRIVDGLAAAGDGRAARLQQAEE
jgi:hypothetical protein